MFQPAGVKTLMQMRSPLPERPSTDSAMAGHRQDADVDFEDRPRPPTAPPEMGSRMMDSPIVARIEQEREEERAEDQVCEDAGSLLQEASSVLQQLQSGWHEERRSEIDELWRQCEAEYGFVLSREDPGTPALGSLRARAGNGVAGLLGGPVNSRCSVEEEQHVEVATMPSMCADEVEADTGIEAAKRDLEATRELRRCIEAKLRHAASPAAALEASAAASALKEQAAVQAEADAQRLGSLRTEVERLRAKAKTVEDALKSTANAASTGSGSGAEIAAEASRPTSAAAAAMASVDLQGPELLALDEWMEDLRVLRSDTALSSDAMQDPEGRGQRQMKAVASPMRVRNSLRSPRGQLSPPSPSSPSKKEMVRLAEQRAMDWASGQVVSPHRSAKPKPKSGPPSPNTRSPKQTSALLSSRGELLGTGYPANASGHSPSAVERQLDDILNELDEIDRIHDDVCTLAHA